MHRVLKILLITLGIILLIYGIYYLVGRPALPVPAFRYKASPDTPLYNIVRATKSGELKLTVVTDGQIDVSSDGDRLASIQYTPKTLGNALAIAGKFMGKNPETFNAQVNKPLQSLASLLYNILRLRLTVLIGT
ncbi:MAG: hypothetical protein VB108_02110 [Anaerolineaceae bacterium]|nr:hypothetical protein [Anaerolineaceae bacterium]